MEGLKKLDRGIAGSSPLTPPLFAKIMSRCLAALHAAQALALRVCEVNVEE
jgi:hypothetical protein